MKPFTDESLHRIPQQCHIKISTKKKKAERKFASINKQTASSPKHFKVYKVTFGTLSYLSLIYLAQSWHYKSDGWSVWYSCADCCILLTLIMLRIFSTRTQVLSDFCYINRFFFKALLIFPFMIMISLRIHMVVFAPVFCIQLVCVATYISPLTFTRGMSPLPTAPPLQPRENGSTA